MDGREGAGWWQCTTNHGSSITASITITILDSYTFAWKRLTITLQQNMEHAYSRIIIASQLMLKVQMHFAFEVDNFHTVDCAVIYYLPGVIIQVYPRPCPGPCNHATAAELCVCRPPDAARPRILVTNLAVRPDPASGHYTRPHQPPARHWHLQVLDKFTFNSRVGTPCVFKSVAGMKHFCSYIYWISVVDYLSM